jgi:hypothetical protein
MLAHYGASKVRRETFDGMPIEDADADMFVRVSDQDIRLAESKGAQRDPANCALAQACASQLGSSRVAFFRRTAYVDLPDAKGNRRVVRFMLDAPAAAIVEAFDKGQSVRGEVVVTMRKPCNSMTLDHLRAKDAARRERRSAIIRGEIAGKPHNVRYHKRPTMADMDVRHGGGRVHNSVKKPQAS